MTSSIRQWSCWPESRHSGRQGRTARPGHRAGLPCRWRLCASRHHPSKTLRHSALTLLNFKRHFGAIVPLTLRPDLELRSLMSHLDHVVRAHERYMAEQLARNGIDQWHGRARFLGPRLLEVLALDGSCTRVTGEIMVIATGSRPRTPEDIPVDHEHILDSDSLLSMLYLPGVADPGSWRHCQRVCLHLCQPGCASDDDRSQRASGQFSRSRVATVSYGVLPSQRRTIPGPTRDRHCGVGWGVDGHYHAQGRRRGAQ